MSLEQRLKEIKERCEAATKGPWEWIGQYLQGKQTVLEFTCETSFGLTGATENLEAKESDKDFIAHARTDVPMLLDMVEFLLNMDNGTIHWTNTTVPDELEKIAEKYSESKISPWLKGESPEPESE